jgi:hypothetical protein
VREAGDEFHRSILPHHCLVKNETVVISRKQLQGDVEEAVGGGLFGPILGAELVLGMPSKALLAMPVHDLCCVLCIARKARVFDFLKTWIARHLHGREEHKIKLEDVIEQHPTITKKNHVTRLLCLGRLSAICQMEHGCLMRSCEFDASLALAVTRPQSTFCMGSTHQNGREMQMLAFAFGRA